MRKGFLLPGPGAGASGSEGNRRQRRSAAQDRDRRSNDVSPGLVTEEDHLIRTLYILSFACFAF